MSLYTKYRPRDWDSVIGQDTISTILRGALKLDRVGHAYILTWSRGTGKTTSARILAKWVNCENLQDGNPCHTCKNCIAFDNGNMLDIIEIDGASNNGVDDVRDLIEKARFEPNQWKYKVYIIDEVHMLSTWAFNALLKTLEEPPDHVKFILATTEIEKVPETIRSRSLRFDFHKIGEIDLIKRLEFVIQSEWIRADTEALAIIAKAARGGMRDALTLLEQHTINSEISTEYIKSSLSLLEESLIEEVILTLRDKDIEKTLEILTMLRNRHIQVRGFFDQILYALRDTLFASIHTPLFHEYEAIFAIFESAYSKIRVIPDSFLLIEITLIRAVKRGGDQWKSEQLRVQTETPTKTVMKNTWQTNTGETEGGKLSESDDIQYNWWAKANEFLSPSEPFVSFQLWKESNTFDTFTPQGGTGSHESTEEKKKSWVIEKEILDSQSQMSTGSHESTKTFSFISLLNTLKTTKPALVVDLKNSQFEVNNNHLKLTFQKEWNYNRVNTSTIKNILCETLEKEFSWNWEVECILWVWHADVSEWVF